MTSAGRPAIGLLSVQRESSVTSVVAKATLPRIASVRSPCASVPPQHAMWMTCI